MQYFSTSRIPERDKLAGLHDFVGRHVARREFRPGSETNIGIDLAAMNLPGEAVLGAARYSPISGRRTRALTADGRDDYLLSIHTREHEIRVDRGQPLHVRAGDLVIVNEGTPSEFHLPQVDVSIIALGRVRLGNLVPGIERDALYHVPAETPGLALLRDYAELARNSLASENRAAALAANHLYELTALVLEGFVRAETGRSERSIRAARLSLAKREILARLSEPDLGVASIARSLGISPRYLQRLFEAEGLTFSDFLREGRLELAFHRLRSDALREVGISVIAYDCGFSDLSHFNRTFRRRYGMTPSEVRAEAMRRRDREPG
jgi:AraC-like DNA-binding protein